MVSQTFYVIHNTLYQQNSNICDQENEKRFVKNFKHRISLIKPQYPYYKIFLNHLMAKKLSRSNSFAMNSPWEMVNISSVDHNFFFHYSCQQSSQQPQFKWRFRTNKRKTEGCTVSRVVGCVLISFSEAKIYYNTALHHQSSEYLV